MPFDLLSHPIIYTRPLRMSGHSAWSGHIPLAYLIIELLRPETFVELGTFDGTSYVGFCQAVKLLNSSTQCFAVDTWTGDAHSGYYGPDLFASLKSFHDAHFLDFSSLLKMTFDEAAREFKDASIDLLHIDGCHAYEAVRHDFECYLPRMSRRGVMLFHDSAIRTGDFGVYRLVEELKPRYPHFEFFHSSGLAIFVIGSDTPREFVDFIAAANANPEGYRAFFTRFGEHVKILVLAHQLAGIQFAQMQVINAYKTKNGLPVDPSTLSLQSAMGSTFAFAETCSKEMREILETPGAGPRSPHPNQK